MIAAQTWGERHLGTSELGAVLKHLAVEQRKTAPEIAMLLAGDDKKFSAETVRRVIKKLDVKPRQPTFAEVVKGLGYKSIPDFFLSPRIARKPHAEVAKMTGHSLHTVWVHWNDVRTALREGRSVGAV